MNIWTQSCGFVLLCVLFLFYRQQKKIQLNTEKAFGWVFCAATVCITLDILSIVALNYAQILPEWFVLFVCKTYLVSLEVVAFCGLMYVCIDIFDKNAGYKKTIRNCLAAVVIGAALIYALPIYYYVEEDGLEVYTYGPSTSATYVVVLILIQLTLFFTVSQKKKLNANRRSAVQSWMIIWIIAALIQFFNRQLLVVGFAGAIGIMILYIRLENPETNLDRKSGLFNQSALQDYLKQIYGKERRYAVLSLFFDYSLDKSNLGETEDEISVDVIHYLSEIEDALLFKYSEDEMVLIFDDIKKAVGSVEMLQSRFESGWGKDDAIVLHPFRIFLPDIRMARSAKDVLPLMKYVREISRDNRRDYVESDLVAVDKQMVEKMYQERETEKLILEAIEQNRIEVYYQPIYSTQEHRFTSAEALVRMKDEKGALVSPGVFISVAEKNGMIIKLGEIVFEKVCQFIQKKKPEQYGIHYIEVNLSVVQCAYTYLAEDYIKIMEQYNIPPRLINLEITESASLSAKKTLLDNMKCLMNYGVKFSLDDFGTGQSNLNYIVDMPVDIVKFDKDMTNAYFENGKAKYVMDAAMHMIHGMNLEIVSEGIETEKQFRTMEELGINYIQGYYFSKPLPEDEFLTFLYRECVKEGK